MKIILTALVSGVFAICQAQQDTGYAHEVLYELSSKKYHGRGYYGNGEIKAAKYICSEMEEIGLGKVGGKQYQSFPITGSIITKSRLKINGISLELGKQFLPGSANPTSSTKIWTTEDVSYTILRIDSNTTKESLVKFFEKDFTGALLIDTFGVKSKVNMRSIWPFIEKKRIEIVFQMFKNDFNHDVARGSSNISLFMIDYEKMPNSIKDISQWRRLEFRTKAKDYNKDQKNVLGLVEGTNKDSTIIVCGHYDHLGQVGKDAIFYGANDNACGIAMLLDMAKYFKKNKPKFNMLFIAFGGEEAGLVGSKYYVENPIVPLAQTKFVLNLDLVGTGHKGMTVVNATVFPEYFKKLTDINDRYNYLPQITRRGKAANSDHYFFTEAGVPAFFGYFQGERSSYHDVFDVPETLPLTKYIDGRELFIKFLEAI